jgi:hypothetical protein
MAEYTAIATSASELSNLLTSDKFGVYPASAYLKCDGVTDDYQALYDLINTTINGASAEVWIKGIVFINENITIPKNIKFKFQNGGMFKIALGKTMTGAYAKLEADIQQIFDLSLVGSVAGNWDVVEVYPEWFGVDKSASNNSAKTQTAIDMTPEGGVLKFTGGEYNFSYPLEINKSITILGAGQFNTVLKFNDSSGLEVNADDVQIEGLKVSTNVKYTTTANEYTAFSLIGDRHILRDIVAYGFKVGVAKAIKVLILTACHVKTSYQNALLSLAVRLARQVLNL